MVLLQTIGLNLKKEKPQNASKIVDSFSDTVYAGYMRNVKYIEHITAQEILCFYCQPTQIVLVGISTNQPIDFTKMESHAELGSWIKELEVFTKTKVYSEAREVEIYKMIENGAKPANGELFNLLCLAL